MRLCTSLRRDREARECGYECGSWAPAHGGMVEYSCATESRLSVSGAASGRGEVRGVQGPSLVAVAGDARPNRPIIPKFPIADRDDNIAIKT